MTKHILTSLIAASSLLAITANSFATELKTSSLAIVKTESSGKMAQQCQKLFKEGDKLISEAEQQPGTHMQVKKMKDRLSSSKQQILKMDTVMQQKSCDKGLLALNTLKQKY